jgi:glycosyltransferase involved in cell wall biosynthesis
MAPAAGRANFHPVRATTSMTYWQKGWPSWAMKSSTICRPAFRSLFQQGSSESPFRLSPSTSCTTIRLDIQARGLDRRYAGGNWVFVSRSLARLYGSERYVYNGIDPSGYVYADRKEDYYLFMSSMDWAFEKGLDTALALAADLGFRLVVAGTSGEHAVIQKIDELCSRAGAKYVGDVRGETKAKLLAGAQALLHPTRLYEGFGLVMAEALMSGTPVICSDCGACPEIISPEVGFVCRQEGDYRSAVERVTEISSRACREKAMQKYHYHRMAEGFVREYEAEIAQPTEGNLIPNLEAAFSPTGGRGL